MKGGGLDWKSQHIQVKMAMHASMGKIRWIERTIYCKIDRMTEWIEKQRQIMDKMTAG